MPKYAPSMKGICSRLQCDLWNLFNQESHAELTEKLMDDTWIAGRRAWLVLDEYHKTKKVSVLNFQTNFNFF